ncbi:MAG TPA: phosphoribosylformylglycinamidine synthase subunit PurL, partial [Micromonosporaceae bacterium]
CDEHGVPWTAIGVVDRGGALEIRNQFTVPLNELREAWTGTLPKQFGGVVATALEPDATHDDQVEEDFLSTYPETSPPEPESGAGDEGTDEPVESPAEQ